MKRRDFIQLAGVSSFVATWVPSSAVRADPLPTARLALDKFVLDPSKITSLKRGVGVMKSRKPSDPTSWFYQSAIHGVSDGLLAAALKQDPAIAQINKLKFWNQCPHFGNASSADFLIWHRAYVYYFERILRKASGDQTLSLPYWNYEDPKQRGCPRIFADPDVDPVTKIARNPLYDARREMAWVYGLYELSDRAVSTSNAFAKATYFDSSADNAFGGAWNDLEPTSQGTLEQSPHNNIHFAIGGVISTAGGSVSDDSAAGLMADPTTSAFDPLFWVHHSNIDRLWNVWGRQKNSAWGSAPPCSWLNASPWWFYDHDGSVQNLPKHSYIDSQKLQVSFDDDDPAQLPVSSKPLPGPPCPIVVASNTTTPIHTMAMDMSRRETPSIGTTVIGVNSRPITLSASIPTKTVVHFKLASPARPASGQLLSVSVPQRVYLELKDVSYNGPPSVGFTLYASIYGGKSPIELGLLNLFGLRHGEHMHPVTRGQRFDITNLAAKFSSSEGMLELSVVPFDLYAAKGPSAPLKRSGNVKIGGFQIITEPAIDR